MKHIENKDAPIKVWAVIGAIIFAFQIYVWTKWITGPFFTPVEIGPSEVPAYMFWAARSMEVGFTGLFLWCVWNFIVKPWRREKQVSFDGLLCMSIGSFVWFQDPLVDYSGAVFTYNSILINMGSWVNDIPGSLMPGKPGAQLSEPLWTAMLYPSVIFLATILACTVMRKAKSRWPNLTPLGLIGITFCFMVIFDVVLEGFVFMPLGLYTYAGAPDWTAMNVDTYYKYTWIEGLGFGAAWTAWAALRYFKDDKGNSIVERGIENLNVPFAQKTIMRFFAIGAFTSVAMFLCVSLPYQFMGGHLATYNEDIQKRSYLLQGLCGEGTNTACFGPNVPLPRSNSSARVTPDGELYWPEGVEKPKLIPFDKGEL